MFRAVGALSALDGIGEIEEAVGSALPGHCSPVAYLLQKNGTVTLFDRKNKSIQRPRERVQKIALVRYNPYGVSTWVALSKITGRFLCSEPRDSISADFFGGDYTDIIAPNRFRQKIADFAAVPRRYLAVLYQNGYLRVFGSGYHSGDILCEDVRGIELEGEELIAYLPADLSYAPAIDLEEPEEGDTLSPAESIVTLGQPVDLPAILSLLRQRVEGWRRAEELAPPAAKKPVRAIRRSERYIYFLYRDGTVEAALLTHTGHSPHGENEVSAWQNVREVIPGRHQTLALCEDGSVLAAGRGYGQPYAVSAWKNVTQLYQSSGLAAAVTAADCTRISGQYASFSTIPRMPRICPSIRFSLWTRLLYSSSLRCFVLCAQQQHGSFFSFSCIMLPSHHMQGTPEGYIHYIPLRGTLSSR